jgi:ribosomal-protein-alanine N-acetyltransferase
MTLFQSERLLIKEFTLADLDYFYQLNGDAEIMQYIRKPRTKAECEILLNQTIEEYKTRPGTGRFSVVDKVTGFFMGSFALLPLDNSPYFHMGYALLKAFQGKGYATELAIAAQPFIFKTLATDVIKAITHPDNTASQNVLKKAGFIQVGNFVHEGTEVILFELKKQMAYT